MQNWGFQIRKGKSTMKYLDCGCSILDNGSRVWCLTCLKGPKNDDQTSMLIQALSKNIEIAEKALDYMDSKTEYDNHLLKSLFHNIRMVAQMAINSK